MVAMPSRHIGTMLEKFNKMGEREAKDFLRFSSTTLMFEEIVNNAFNATVE